ncbi:MAG: hypothetical protein ACQEXJ_17080 [Myxococcota bacterium]
MHIRSTWVLATLGAAGILLTSACDDGGGSGTGEPTGCVQHSDDPNAPYPPQVACDDAGTCTVEAPQSCPIVENFTMTADKQWLLQGGVFVGDDIEETVLTIEPDTTVYGETSSKAFLTIRRGSRIVADGTATAPIVFTSSKAEGSRARGDWGGVVLNGRAPVNGCNTPPCEAEGEGGSGLYGGDDPLDDSGVLRYVRVEFAGHPITEDNELNGIAFQGVGAGTTIDHVQIHMAADDGIEFFGGTAEWKHVLTTGISDDNLDWTDGWQGKGQFFVAQQYADAGDNGIEADNNGENNAATPRSQPTLANLTLIGVPSSNNSDLGILLREGTGANIYNAIVTGWNDACFDVDHSETFANAVDGDGMLTGDLTIESSIVSCDTAFEMGDEEDADGNPVQDPWSVEEFFTSMNPGNEVTDPMLQDPMNTAAPDVRPADGSPARTGATVPQDPFFEAVDFIGGVDPDDDWTAGWTTSARN